MTTLAERFTGAASRAAQPQFPNPTQLSERIDELATPGIPGTAYDRTRTHGGDHTSQPERQAAAATRSRIEVQGHNAQHAAHRSYLAAWEAITILAALVLDEGEPATWRDVTATAVRIGKLDHGHRIGAELDVDQGDIAPAVHSYVNAIDTIDKIAGDWTAHPPSQYQQDHGTWCKNHIRLGLRKERRTRALCQWCWRQILDLEPLGDPVALQLDPLMWPTDDMIRAREDGRATDMSGHRRDWLVTLGLDPLQVANRRQVKRSA